MDNNKGYLMKVLGLFSFINFIWFLSICGVMITIVPIIVVTVNLCFG